MATASTSAMLPIPSAALSCNVCATPLKSFEELNVHLTLHTQPFPDEKAVPTMPEPAKAAGRLLCPWLDCKHTTVQRTNLKTHYYRHLKIQPHRCPHLVPSTVAEYGWEKCMFKTVDPACLTRHRRSKHGYVPGSDKAATKDVIPAAVVAVTMTSSHPKDNGKGKARAAHHPYARPSKSSDTEKGKTVARPSSPFVKIEGTGTPFDPIELFEWDSDAPPVATIPMDFKPSPAATPAYAYLAPPTGFDTSMPAPQYLDCSFAPFEVATTSSAANSHAAAVEQFLNNYTPMQSPGGHDHGLYQFADMGLPVGLRSAPTPVMIPQPAPTFVPSAAAYPHQEFNFVGQPDEDWSTLFQQPVSHLPSFPPSSAPARVLSPLDHFAGAAALQSIPQPITNFGERAYYNLLQSAAASVASSSIPSTPSELEYSFLL